MGPELRQVVQTIMSDLGMGEDQSKIDALEQYLEENLSTFFSEDSYMSSVIKMGAEKSFTSHSARIKEFLTRGIGGEQLWETRGRLLRHLHHAHRGCLLHEAWILGRPLACGIQDQLLAIIRVVELRIVSSGLDEPEHLVGSI